MINLVLWILLGIISVILLVIFWRTRNAVWGGLTLGIIIGFILVFVFNLEKNEFDWLIIIKSAILGVLLGFLAELLGKFSDFIKKRNP